MIPNIGLGINLQSVYDRAISDPNRISTTAATAAKTPPCSNPGVKMIISDEVAAHDSAALPSTSISVPGATWKDFALPCSSISTVPVPSSTYRVNISPSSESSRQVPFLVCCGHSRMPCAAAASDEGCDTVTSAMYRPKYDDKTGLCEGGINPCICVN